MKQTILESIEERNKRVEAEKAWETSKTRRGVIAVITYFIAVLFLQSVGIPSPWLNAFVPAGGYILSTMSMPFFKRWWLRKIYNK